MKTITLSAIRNVEDDFVLLLFKFHVRNDIMNNKESLISALKKGLTNWAANTVEGKEAWEQSSEDFNFADFAPLSHLGNINKFLEEVGIYGWSSVQLEETNIVDLDCILMDGTQIDKD